MKIIKLEAENIKRLTAVSITPEGSVIEITGKNGQGKTSVLDAIWWALAGTAGIQREPIHRGAKKALIRLDLGQFTVTRRFNSQDDGTYTTSLAVENAEGFRPTSPQTMLDALVGELTFDPLEFTRMKPASQFEALRKFVPGVDFDAIDKANKADYEARAEASRSAKQLRAQAEGVHVPEDLPEKPVDIEALVVEQREGAKFNQEIETRKNRRNEHIAETGRLADKATGLRSRAQALREQADGFDTQAAEIETQVKDRSLAVETAEALPEPVDLTPIGQKIIDAGNINKGFDAKNQRGRLIIQAEAYEETSQGLTDAIAARNEAKQKAIAAAQMPVPGITFGDGVILYNGFPFDQAADSEQLRASIAIGAAMNPRLRVMRVRDGSLLDTDSMKLLAEFAEAHDCQVWIETVASGRAGAVVIEDGHVQGQEVTDGEA